MRTIICLVLLGVASISCYAASCSQQCESTVNKCVNRCSEDNSSCYDSCYEAAEQCNNSCADSAQTCHVGCLSKAESCLEKPPQANDVIAICDRLREVCSEKCDINYNFGY